MSNAALSAPVSARVIKRRADGSGIVEIPVAVETPYLDAGRTETGKGPSSLPLSALKEMVENFQQYPGPVGVGVGTHLRDASGPAAGFIDGLELRGDVMWARIDAGPSLFAQIVGERAWRGFSIEAARDLKKPTIQFKGWVVTGGIFTNAPALDVHYQIAASSSVVPADVVSIPLRLSVAGEEESKMEENTISLASHEAKLNEVRSESISLKAERDSYKDAADKAKAEAAKLRERFEGVTAELAEISNEKITYQARANKLQSDLNLANNELKAIRTSLTEAEAKLAEANKAALSAKVTSLVEDAIEAGIKPATFDGWQADPADYVSANYGSYEVFEKFVTSLRSHAGAKVEKVALKSGHDPKASASETEDSVTDEEKAILKRLGLDKVDFSGVTTEEQARERFLAAQGAK